MGRFAWRAMAMTVGFALVVDVAFGVLQGEPFGNEVREVAEMEAERDDAGRVPVDVETPDEGARR